MKKSKFIKSSIILIIGGFCTKILGMLIKIILTRQIGTQGIGLYSLLSPTFGLLISISGMGLTTSLNVLIASNKYNNKNLIFYSLLLSLTIDFILIILLILFGHVIANNLLKNSIFYYPIISMGFILPFITISNIFRSYYFAKERMYPHVISNVLEDLIKLLLIIFFTKYFLDSFEKTLTFILLTNIFCESSSIIIFLTCFPKFNITKDDLKLNIHNLKAIFNISIPTVISRLIGSISYFFEPIILTTILLKLGYNNNYIITEYGIINGYVLPIILLPSFFTNAISQALIPNISSNYAKGNIKEVKRKLNQALFIALILGITFTSLFFFSGSFLLKVLYKTNQGYNYLLILLPIFIFHYLEQPLLSTLQAMNKAKINLKISIVNMLIRTLGLIFFTSLNIGIYSLIIVLSINIIFTCFYSYLIINKQIKCQKK